MQHFLFTLCSLLNALKDGKSPATAKKSEHPPVFESISIAFNFLTDKHSGHRGRLSIRAIISLKHLKAFGRSDTEEMRRVQGSGEAEQHKFQMCAL